MQGVGAMITAQTRIPSILPTRQSAAFALVSIVIIAILPL
jgi:hypothetical protein